MTKTERAIIISYSMNMLMANKELRYGQCLFNVARKLFPNEVDKIRTTDDDCFYIDQNAERFLEKLEFLTKK